MSLETELQINTAQEKRIISTLKNAPAKVVREVKKEWNVEALAFRSLMQDLHLSGGTTVDRLARRTSTLYSSLKHEVVINKKDVNVSVWFLDTVADYAPTHEKGDESRNIPPRMNLENEWVAFENKFFVAAEVGIERGLKDA